MSIPKEQKQPGFIQCWNEKGIFLSMKMKSPGNSCRTEGKASRWCKPGWTSIHSGLDLQQGANQNKAPSPSLQPYINQNFKNQTRSGSSRSSPECDTPKSSDFVVIISCWINSSELAEFPGSGLTPELWQPLLPPGLSSKLWKRKKQGGVKKKK